MNEVIVERAKDGNLTCKRRQGTSFKYVYSKYRPANIELDLVINPNCESILLFGYGLGYEYERVKMVTDKKIYVIEGHEIFLSLAVENQIKVISKEAAKKLMGYSSTQIVQNKNIMDCYTDFYEELFEQNNKSNLSQEIVVFDYVVIAKDCAEAFSNLGFQVRYVTDELFVEFEESLKRKKPKFMFGVNFQTHLADFAEQWEIPYIYWVVDTPNFNLFYEKNKFRQYSIGFIYDRVVVEELIAKGFRNVHYMPVAANTNRLNNVSLSSEDLINYRCDVSFLGNTCVQNEYTQYIEPKIDTYSKDLIERLITAQMYNERFVIKEVISNEIAEAFFDLSGIIFKEEAFQGNLQMKDSMSMFLGRYHSYVERAKVVNNLSKNFDVAVFGDKEWLNILEQPSIYRGNAEHYLEMPKVFKASKINLNMIRSFVESGLPMRVFDVLGSTGFLLTNQKQDITEYFIDGKDLVIYRDEKDLSEIIQYYLTHEEERLEIAQTGFNKVKQEHTFEKRLQQIMTICQIDCN